MSKAKSVSSVNEDEWKAKDDARHLIESQKVQADPKRHKAAKGAMDTMEKEAKDTLLHVKAAKGLKKAFGGGC